MLLSSNINFYQMPESLRVLRRISDVSGTALLWTELSHGGSAAATPAVWGSQSQVLQCPWRQLLPSLPILPSCSFRPSIFLVSLVPFSHIVVVGDCQNYDCRLLVHFVQHNVQHAHHHLLLSCIWKSHGILTWLYSTTFGGGVELLGWFSIAKRSFVQSLSKSR